MRKTGLVVMVVLGAACAPAKDDGKGVVDDSTPPAIPTEGGKADDASRTIEVSVESAHPYVNYANEIHAVPLTGLPSCASEARLHFAVLRTEAHYDFVTVEPEGAPVQEFDGNRDGTWTEWFPISGPTVNVRLDSDGSITRHGFEIDKVEWRGGPICPAVVHPPCEAGTIDVGPALDVCACPQPAQCADLATVEIRHARARGFEIGVHTIRGDVASETRPGPSDAPVTSVVGSVDVERIGELIERAGDLGLLHGVGYSRPIPVGTYRDELQITAGEYTVTFVAGDGEHDPAVQQLIHDFEAMFQCGTEAAAVTCGNGHTCGDDGMCIREATCVCPALYDPVCSTSGQTFSNACAAGCANVEVAHDGECGITGDTCGTMRGLACQDDYKCRFHTSTYEYPYPDAGGTCVPANYCDAPVDCEGLPHIAVPGAWACEQNTCAWQPGIAWKQVTGGTFETAHPYANGTSVWKELYLPAGAQALRLVTAPGFALETGYDFLEVWTWKNGAWVRVTRYTGTTGPAATDEFPGRYNYLRFVSDSSITTHGFRVTAEWR